MAETIFTGKTSHKLKSLGVMLRTVVGVLLRRVIGKPLEPAWSMTFEIGTLFWRRQFNRALAMPSIAEGRDYFDSMYNVIDTYPDVEIRPSTAFEPKGDWFLPKGSKSELTMLYLHGGGYAFYGAVTRHFIAMLAHMLQVRIFAPDYRLTPENPHPAQQEDSLNAYRYLIAKNIRPQQLIIAGDSAGGHLTLMTLVRLRDLGLPQPAMAIALSPWTDIGKRGASQFGNDVYDLVQGYQTLLYAQWLKGTTARSDTDLSPIYQDFRGLAPVYLQAGGKEILVDMIRDFARTISEQGALVRLDVWEHMTHEFHAYGHTLPESWQAIGMIRAAMNWATCSKAEVPFLATEQTEIDRLHFSRNTRATPRSVAEVQPLSS